MKLMNLLKNEDNELIKEWR